MRDVYLFTKKPMIYEECEETIFVNIKNVAANKKNTIWTNSKIFWKLEIVNETIFEGADSPDYIQELAEWAQNIPIEEPFVNYISVHRSIDAKRIIQALILIYPDLYINVDDQVSWYGTAQEYLDTQFDY